MSWKKAFQQRQEIILGTSSLAGQPRVIVVISLGFINSKLLIGSCLMKTTLANLKANNRVSIFTKRDKEYYRLEGKVTIYSSGKYLKLAKAKSNPPLPKYALLVDIKEVFDLDKGKIVYVANGN